MRISSKKLRQLASKLRLSMTFIEREICEIVGDGSEVLELDIEQAEALLRIFTVREVVCMLANTNVKALKTVMG